MVDPVSSGVRGEGEMIYGISVDFVIELEKDAEASLCEGRMRGFGENVIV
jgi:hypothetical protein